MTAAHAASQWSQRRSPSRRISSRIVGAGTRGRDSFIATIPALPVSHSSLSALKDDSDSTAPYDRTVYDTALDVVRTGSGTCTSSTSTTASGRVCGSQDDELLCSPHAGFSTR